MSYQSSRGDSTARSADLARQSSRSCDTIVGMPRVEIGRAAKYVARVPQLGAMRTIRRELRVRLGARSRVIRSAGERLGLARFAQHLVHLVLMRDLVGNHVARVFFEPHVVVAH